VVHTEGCDPSLNIDLADLDPRQRVREAWNQMAGAAKQKSLRDNLMRWRRIRSACRNAAAARLLSVPFSLLALTSPGIFHSLPLNVFSADHRAVFTGQHMID